MSDGFQATGSNAKALFTLKVHRGEGMALLAMNWKRGQPSDDFVGFAISYKEPAGDRFFPLTNRLSFPRPDGSIDLRQRPTTLAPIQKFRWVHFPRNAELDGDFLYRVTPVFMNERGELSYGDEQEVPIPLRRETYPGKLNVTFTRGFVSSQAFVDRFASKGPISTLLPDDAKQGLDFTPTHPETAVALDWMGFEARNAILEVLQQAVDDPRAQVRVIAYDLNEPEIVDKLEALGKRLRVIVDDSDDHGKPDSAETAAAARLGLTAAAVKRQHLGDLQHNKTIVIDGQSMQTVVCGSTNFSWRGFFVQSNNALVMHGAERVKVFRAAFDDYFASDNKPATFAKTKSAKLTPLRLRGIDAQVGFSPHGADTALLKAVADDVSTKTTSSVLYSLAFLNQTRGPIRTAIKTVTDDPHIFVYGVSDTKVGGLDVQKPDGNVAPVSFEALTKDVPPPFNAEPIGGKGIRMHHKFVVIDFDQPTARVWLGSYNFSGAADTSNGENLLLVKDRRVAVAYAVEALRIFDHYHFRVAHEEAKAGRADALRLTPAPRTAADKPWWYEYYTDPHKVRDREMFA
jgi:phosphatidylserine/phosphatidylglycerophosphate/cardiolipin synthase-like enzyme